MGIPQSIIHQILEHQDLTESDAHDVAMTFLSGEAPIDDMVTVLSALHKKGESVSEILGFIRAMRTHMTPLSFTESPIMDICGTGGSLPNRFNVSTCAAMVLGAIGHSVAKHGNRGSKKPNGSFDFLDALGIAYELTPDGHQEMMTRHGATFLFARQYHPAVRHVVNARKQLTSPSIFNLIGPFCNPASPSIQVIGAPSKRLAKKLVMVGDALSYDTFAVITSDIGLDECSTVGKSHIEGNRNGQAFQLELDPTTLGIHHQLSDITISPTAMATDNAHEFKAILSNQSLDHPIAQLISLNAGVILHIINSSTTISDGYQLAGQALMDLSNDPRFTD